MAARALDYNQLRTCFTRGGKNLKEQPSQHCEGLREEPRIGLHHREQAGRQGAGGEGQQGTNVTFLLDSDSG